MLAVESIAGKDGGLEVILGLGVVLTFGGLLLRAVTGRFARSRAGTALTAWLDAAATSSAEPSGSSNREPVSLVAARARELAVLADLCEPEPQRLSDGCLAPLARTLDVSRRLVVAEESVALALAGLPVEAWLVERNVLVGALLSTVAPASRAHTLSERRVRSAPSRAKRKRLRAASMLAPVVEARSENQRMPTFRLQFVVDMIEALAARYDFDSMTM